MLARVRRAALSAAIALAAGGCSVGDEEKPKPARGATSGVATTVAALERATRAGDFATVCDRLFTASARKRAGGADCARLLRSQARDVRRPTIRVVGIRIRGERASVRVRTTAQGQPPVVDTLELVREGGGYRVDALGS